MNIPLSSLRNVNEIVKYIQEAHDNNHDAALTTIEKVLSKLNELHYSPTPGVPHTTTCTSTENKDINSFRPGIPTLNASFQRSLQCSFCTKIFSTFSRGHYCRSCGFMFCRKCAAVKQILPHPFGYESTPVRVCEICLGYFQGALDIHFEKQSSQGGQVRNIYSSK